MFPFLEARRPGPAREQGGQKTVLSREDEVALQKDDEPPAVGGVEGPPGDRSALFAEQAVGDLDGHDAVEPIVAGERGPVRRLANAPEAAGPAAPQGPDLVVRDAHRGPRKKASSRARSRSICERVSRFASR